MARDFVGSIDGRRLAGGRGVVGELDLVVGALENDGAGSKGGAPTTTKATRPTKVKVVGERCGWYRRVCTGCSVKRYVLQTREEAVILPFRK